MRFADGWSTTARVVTFDGLADGREHLARGSAARPRRTPYAAGARAQRVPDRRRPRQRAAATAARSCASRSSGSPTPAATCSTCARRAVGSGCTRSSTPTRSRTRAWTPTRPTSPSGTARTSATTPPPRRCCRHWGSGASPCSPTTPTRPAQLTALGIEVAELVPTAAHLSASNARYLAAKVRHGHRLPGGSGSVKRRADPGPAGAGPRNRLRDDEREREPGGCAGIRLHGRGVHPPADPDDPLRADARHVPGCPRPDDREHVDPHHRRRPQRAVDPGVGDHGVPDHRDDHDADLRQARRQLRSQEALHVRDHRLHRRLRAVLVRDLDAPARRVPRLPGTRRGRTLHAGPRDHRRHRVAARTGPLHRLLHGDVRHVERARPADRWVLRRTGGDPRASTAGAGSSWSTSRSASSRCWSSTAPCTSTTPRGTSASTGGVRSRWSSAWCRC